MHIVCQKDILLNGINTVSKAVPNKTTMPILECILLSTSKNKFKLIANDLELGIESTLEPVEIIEDGAIALEAKIFSEIIRRLPEDKVDITTDENNLTIIKCKNSEYKIMGQLSDDFPNLPDIEKNVEYTLSQVELKNMIKQTIFSISDDDSKPNLKGELLEITDKSINVVAVDGYRVSFRKTSIENNKESISRIIPGKTLNEIIKILSSEDEDKVSIYFTDRHMLLDLGLSKVVSRTIDGEFIRYEQIFSNDYNTKLVVNCKDIIMSLERASLLSRDNKKIPVKIEIKAKKMIITSNTELGTAYEEVDIDMDGNEMSIAFNPKYIIECLKAIEDEEICMYFTSSLSPCIIKPIQADDYKYLVLPVRLNI